MQRSTQPKKCKNFLKRTLSNHCFGPLIRITERTEQFFSNFIFRKKNKATITMKKVFLKWYNLPTAFQSFTLLLFWSPISLCSCCKLAALTIFTKVNSPLLPSYIRRDISLFKLVYAFLWYFRHLTELNLFGSPTPALIFLSQSIACQPTRLSLSSPNSLHTLPFPFFLPFFVNDFFVLEFNYR